MEKLKDTKKATLATCKNCDEAIEPGFMYCSVACSFEFQKTERPHPNSLGADGYAMLTGKF